MVSKLRIIWKQTVGGGSDEEGLQTDLTRLRPRAVAYYAVQVVQALDALHTSQIVSSESLALAPL